MKTLYFIMQIGDSYGTPIKPTVYAVTREKELAKSFIETRRGDIFKVEKLKCHKKDMYNTLDNYAPQVLFKEHLHTHSEYNDQHIIDIVLTNDESVKVFSESDRLLEEFSRFTDPMTFVLRDSILWALNGIGYFAALRRGHNTYFNLEKFDDFFMNIDVDTLGTSLVPDEFEVFMRYFGWTMLRRKKVI